MPPSGLAILIGAGPNTVRLSASEYVGRVILTLTY
jgi:NAD(P)-dependent dehydrogenase (short-subunit alcohol dehydrogenase family)